MLKNATIREIIQKLQTLDPDAIFCRMDPDGDVETIYSTVEMIKSVGEVEYIDHGGDTVTGNVVAIY